MLSQSKSRIIFRYARSVSTSTRRCANHYDVLGVTPKATQSEIKTAYYKQSKIYHPDKSNDEESAKKFRALTEAYEVLGNIKLKKMYDKGLLVGRENTTRMDYHHPEPEPTDPTLKFYKSRLKRNIVPTMDGKTPVYDFDAWAKNHYGEVFRKSQYEKDILKEKRAKREAIIHSNRQEALLYLIFALGGLFIVLVINGTEDYDKNTIVNNNKEQLQADNQMK